MFKEDKPYIYVSYSYKDNDRVSPIIEELKKRGANLWRFCDIYPEPWIEDSIEVNYLLNSSVVLAFISKKYDKSGYRRKELQHAVKHNKSVIAVAFEDFLMGPMMQESLSSVPILRYDQYDSLSSFCDDLVPHFQNCINQSSRKKKHEQKTQPADKPSPTSPVANVEAKRKPIVASPDFVIRDGTLVKYEGNKQEVVVPDGVTKIGMWAFDMCKSLIRVTLPRSVTEIGEGAFCHCENLIGIQIPYGVTVIDADTFYHCEKMKTVTLPDTVTEIRDHAFWGCESLTGIKIPNGVTTIGTYAFWGCESLTGIKIPNGVTTIGEGAFSSCESLTSITIPNGVTTIGEGAFRWCKSLTSVTIPDTVLCIGESAFDGCNVNTVYVSPTAPCYRTLRNFFPSVRFSMPR